MNFEDLNVVSVFIDALALIFAVTLPVGGGIWGIITSSRKYELTTQFRMELLSWYSETVKIMIDVIHYINCGMFNTQDFAQNKIELLSKLSTQIEIGRFYFPNVPNKNGYGNEKPLAYQGNRHVVLEFMFKFYTVASKSSNADDCNKLWDLERKYTSEIFSVIDPKVRNKKHQKYTNITIDEDKNYFKYLSKSGRK